MDKVLQVLKKMTVEKNKDHVWIYIGSLAVKVEQTETTVMASIFPSGEGDDSEEELTYCWAKFEDVE